MDALPNFNPSPELSDQLIDLFSNPTLSLQDIAKKFNTTLAALSIYLSRPETQARLAVVDDVNARRVRAVANHHLAAVADSVAQLISASTALNAQFPAIAGDPASYEQTRRRHESTRRAAHLLLRLANFYPNQPPKALHTTTRGYQTTLPTSNAAQAQQPTAAPVSASAPAPLHPKLEAIRIAAQAHKAATLQAAATLATQASPIDPSAIPARDIQPAAITNTQPAAQDAALPPRHTASQTEQSPPRRPIARNNIINREPAFAEPVTAHPP